MPQKHKNKSWAELKQAGNECFKTGQYGEATNLYSQAIKDLEKSSKCSLIITFIFIKYIFTYIFFIAEGFLTDTLLLVLQFYSFI